MKRKLLKRIGYTILILFVLLNIMAAFHAYNFTKFYDSTEAKEKFDPAKAGFGEKVTALLFGVKSYKQKIDSVPVYFETIQLKTSDSITLEAWQSTESWLDSRPTNGTVILFHGHGGNKAGVLSEAMSFIGLYYKVLLVDFRAHGNSSGNVCTIGYDEAKDVKAAYDHVVSKGEKNIILYGISLGAAAEMKAVEDFGLRPAAMILEMPFANLIEAVKARCRLLGVPQQPTASLLTFWGGIERGFNGFDHDPEDYAKNINCPVLMQWGAKDNRVSEAETEIIFRNIPSKNKLLVKYAASGHQSLCKNENEKWRNAVSAFLAGLKPTS